MKAGIISSSSPFINIVVAKYHLGASSLPKLRHFINFNIIKFIKRAVYKSGHTYTFIYTRQSENCLINNINNYELIATAYHFQAKSDSLKHRGAGVGLYMMSKSGLFNAYSSTT